MKAHCRVHVFRHGPRIDATDFFEGAASQNRGAAAPESRVEAVFAGHHGVIEDGLFVPWAPGVVSASPRMLERVEVVVGLRSLNQGHLRISKVAKQLR